MFTTVYAAETQFRLDSARRDRELAHLVAIREHLFARAHAARRAPAVAVASAPRRVWARPIGLATRVSGRQPQVAVALCCV